MTSERTPGLWRDRYGEEHRELLAQAPAGTASVPRVPGPLELAWNEEDPARERLLREALFASNPIVSPGGEETEGKRLYTWVVSEPFASSVLLLANGAFDPHAPEQSQFTRLEGTGTWVLTLQLPSDWRASYRLAIWEGEEEPPWTPADGRDVAAAALQASLPDPRCQQTMTTPAGRFSVAAGPDAPQEPWHSDEGAGAGTAHEYEIPLDGEEASPEGDADDEAAVAVPIPAANVDALEFPVDGAPAQRVWVYRPPQHGDLPEAGGQGGSDGSQAQPDGPDAQRTPLLVLFDGQTWKNQVGLPELLDEAIAAGAIPPVHVAMIDSREVGNRSGSREAEGSSGSDAGEHGDHPGGDERLGIPGGQVDFVLDVLLPRLREEYPVDAGAGATVVAGQGQGGLSALWTLALGKDEIGHAIAQSPALWRFDVAGPLLANAAWHSATLQAGRYEGETLELCQALAEAVTSSPELGEREIRVEAVSGGYDWAWWRAGLFQALAMLLA